MRYIDHSLAVLEPLEKNIHAEGCSLSGSMMTVLLSTDIDSLRYTMYNYCLRLFHCPLFNPAKIA